MHVEKRNGVNTADDNAVIDRVLAGEKTAYELLMRKYSPRLFRIIRSYLTDEDEIEDVIQEAYVKAYEALPRFEKRSSFSTWLIRIALNEALARVRLRRRHTPLHDGHPNEDGHEVGLEQTVIKENPLGTLMNSELKDILEQAVDRLPEKYKLVFLMREVEGMSVAETSESLEISQTNVKVRLSRAKEMLRDSISHVYRGSDIFHFDLVRCDRIVNKVMSRIGT